MASGRLWLGVGAVGLGGAGAYYLYTAGGDTKLAKKEFEHDTAKLQSRVYGDASSRGTEAKKGFEASAQQVGSSIDYAVEQAKSEGKYYAGQVQAFGKDVERRVNDTVEQAKAQGKEYQRELQSYGRDAEKKLGEAYDKAKVTGEEYQKELQNYQADAEKKLDEARKETGSRLMKAVDSFDRTVSRGAARAQGSIFGWFGGKESS